MHLVAHDQDVVAVDAALHLQRHDIDEIILANCLMNAGGRCLRRSVDVVAGLGTLADDAHGHVFPYIGIAIDIEGGSRHKHRDAGSECERSHCRWCFSIYYYCSSITIEGIFADAGHAVADGDRGQAAAIIEGTFANAGHAVSLSIVVNGLRDDDCAGRGIVVVASISHSCFVAPEVVPNTVDFY